MNAQHNLKDSPILNLIWLLLIVASSSIGYILTSGTNETVMGPCLTAFIVCLVIFVACMLKNVMLKAIKR